MGHRDQQDRNRIIQGDFGKEGEVSVAGQRAAEVFHRAAVGEDVDHAAHDAVGAQRKDQGGNAEIGDAHAVDQANDGAGGNHGQQHDRDAALLLGDQAGHGGGQPQRGADGYIDFTGHDDEGDADGQERIHRGGVKAADDVGIAEELRLRDACDQKQQQKENQAGHPPGFQQALDFVHLATTLSCPIPNDALVSAS